MRVRAKWRESDPVLCPKRAKSYVARKCRPQSKTPGTFRPGRMLLGTQLSGHRPPCRQPAAKHVEQQPGHDHGAAHPLGRHQALAQQHGG